MDPYSEFGDIEPESPEREVSPVRWKKRAVIAALSCAAVTLVAWTSLEIAVRSHPFPKENLNVFRHSAEWFSADGEMIAASLDDAGRRSPERALKEISPWLVKATEAAEDRRFRDHDGVDRLRVVRAAFDNLTGGRRVSGASTITMQLCRLMNDRPRTYAVKLDEAWLALRLDRALSKDEQMALYLNNAPYGGNRVGVEAACRAYFGHGSDRLTIAEAALIAGLPQSPERLRPDRHPGAAKARRSLVLARMQETGAITAAQRASADREPVSVKATREPVIAPHFIRIAEKERPSGGVLTLDAALQREANRLLETALSGRDVSLQGAVVIVDLRTGATLARVGSVPGHAAADVDHTRRRRSPGSTPKTFVYATAFEDRRVAPDTTLSDATLDRFTWNPRNFDKRVRGDVTVAEALRESLNLPAIALTRTIGLARAVAVANSCGVVFRAGAPERAGLSWTVGGAETSLDDLVSGYATIGTGGVTVPRRIFADTPEVSGVRVLSKETCAALDDCLGVSDAHVPAGWETLGAGSRPWFMWKTGTSSGGRDAWAVGHNGRFAAGVWIGTTKGRVKERVFSRTHAEPVLAALFSSPALRNNIGPAPHFGPWWSLVEKASPVAPRIVDPAGVIVYATNDVATLWPKLDRPVAGAWFLDDTPLSAAELKPLRVRVGDHELRFVTAEGLSAAVRFTVETPE